MLQRLGKRYFNIIEKHAATVKGISLSEITIFPAFFPSGTIHSVAVYAPDCNDKTVTIW